MKDNIDNIELKLPFKAEYVSAARLLASSVANRVGFDIETIEDIKVAIAEVCNKLVKAGSKTADNYKVLFEISEEKMSISFQCEDKGLMCIFGEEEDQLGIAIITALMDDVEFCNNNDYILTMFKSLKGNI